MTSCISHMSDLNLTDFFRGHLKRSVSATAVNNKAKPQQRVEHGWKLICNMCEPSVHVQ